MPECEAPKEPIEADYDGCGFPQFAQTCVRSGIVGLSLLSRAIALRYYGGSAEPVSDGAARRSAFTNGKVKFGIANADNGEQAETVREANPCRPGRQEILHMAAPLTRKSAAERSLVRRKHERFPLSETVWVSCRGIAKGAMLVDFSVGGLRLDGTFGLMPGDQISVRLASGEELAGSVAWSLGGAVGVAFPTDRSKAQFEFLMARVRPSKAAATI